MLGSAPVKSWPGGSDQCIITVSADYYKDYLSHLMREKIPPSERVTRTFDELTRRKAASRLSNLMRQLRPFSFVRMGDMEMGLLLAEQHGKNIEWSQNALNNANSSSTVWGHPGIDMNLVPRMKAAYERATYVDFGERIWMQRALVPLLQLNRPKTSFRNQGEEDSHLFMDWFRFEFEDYCRGRQILFVGAEALLLHELFSMKQYRALAAAYFPEDAAFFFQEESGTKSAEIETIKARIAVSLAKNKIDTLFICLGGAAKILCQELAEEFKICAFDAGSAMRALSFAASDGLSGVLSPHHPFLLHVPFETHMTAVERAWPEISSERLLAKAQCQVLRELCDQILGESSAVPGSLTGIPSERCAGFRSSLHQYTIRYSELEDKNAGTRQIRNEFRRKVFSLRHNQKWWWRWPVRLSKRGQSFLRRFAKHG